jgi:hypothetical protein
MPSPAWEKLSDFLQPGDFAVAVDIQFQAGGARSVAAIFDDPYLDAQAGEYVMDNSQPRLTGRWADFVGVKRGDYVVVDGVTYDVMDAPKSDGTGMVVVHLATQ